VRGEVVEVEVALAGGGVVSLAGVEINQRIKREVVGGIEVLFRASVGRGEPVRKEMKIWRRGCRRCE